MDITQKFNLFRKDSIKLLNLYSFNLYQIHLIYKYMIIGISKTFEKLYITLHYIFERKFKNF